MKKISIIAAAAALTLSQGVFAKDIVEGTFSLSGSTGGGLNIISSEVKPGNVEFDTVAVNLDTFARYFIQENLAVGLGYSYSSSNTELEDGTEFESSTLILKPGVFFNHSLNEDNSILFGATIGFGSGEEGATGSQTQTTDIFGFDLSASYQHFVTDSVALNIDAIYSMVTFEDDETGSELDSSGLSLSFGATLYLF